MNEQSPQLYDQDLEAKKEFDAMSHIEGWAQAEAAGDAEGEQKHMGALENHLKGMIDDGMIRQEDLNDHIDSIHEVQGRKLQEARATKGSTSESDSPKSSDRKQELENKYDGAYSTLFQSETNEAGEEVIKTDKDGKPLKSNRHTYIIDENGKKRQVKREVALKEAAEYEDLLSSIDDATPEDRDDASFEAPNAKDKVGIKDLLDANPDFELHPGSVNPKNATPEEFKQYQADVLAENELKVFDRFTLELIQDTCNKLVQAQEAGDEKEVKWRNNILKTLVEAHRKSGDITAEDMPKVKEIYKNALNRAKAEFGSETPTVEKLTREYYTQMKDKLLNLAGNGDREGFLEQFKIIEASINASDLSQEDKDRLLTAIHIDARKAARRGAPLYDELVTAADSEADEGDAEGDQNDADQPNAAARVRNAAFAAAAIPFTNETGVGREKMSRRKKLAIAAGALLAGAAGVVIAHRAGVDMPRFSQTTEIQGGGRGGNGNLDAVADAMQGNGPKPKGGNLDAVAGALGANGSPKPSPEAIAQLNESITDRTNEVLATKGTFPWDRAEALYGPSATSRLEQAVETLKSQGIDAHWHGEGVNRYIEIDGVTNTDAVWNQLADVLARQDVENFLSEAAKVNS